MDSIIRQVKERVGTTEAEDREDLQQLFKVSLPHYSTFLIV